MLGNPALVHNAWAFAKNERLSRDLTTGDEKKSRHSQAEEHAKVAMAIAELAEAVSDDTREGWCSGCFIFGEHRKVAKDGLGVTTYLCNACGTPTTVCASPNCAKMAIRKPVPGLLRVRAPRFCAEHRHDIPSFARAGDKVATLDQYRNLFEHESVNLSRVSKVAIVGAAAAGVVAAPAVGGAIGGMAGLSGAAATSYGLAMLGGGSLAAGGFGMVGGTYVVAAMGAALGTALGASVTNAYVGEDKSFRIEKFIDGPGIPVIVARGFTTEKSNDWNAAMQIVEKRYPDSPIFRLHWGSKELKDLAALAAKNLGAVGLGPLAPAHYAASIVKNPWHTAVARADRTGVALAGILARTELDRVILVGHSLGGRAMITAAETLSSSPDVPQIESVHLLGAAEGARGDWRALSESVTASVHNYHSTNDAVLKYLYRAAQGGSTAVGLNGFNTGYASIVDHDVSNIVKGHSQYFDKCRLV